MDKTSDKISVIIPIYNGEKYIVKCLNSVLEQSYKTLEIICINDGSSDNTDKILNQYRIKDNRIIVINKENTGVSNSRNIGLSIATGKYITFVDIDDWLEKNSIKMMYEMIIKNDVDCIRTNYQIINSDNQINCMGESFYSNENIYPHDKYFVKNLMIDLLKGKFKCYTCLLLIKNEIIIDNKIMFCEDVRFCEDKIFYFDILSNINSIRILNNPTYNYFINNESVTRNPYKYENNLLDVLKTVHVISEKTKSQSRFMYLEKKIKTYTLKDVSYLLFQIYNALGIKKSIENYNKVKCNQIFKKCVKESSYFCNDMKGFIDIFLIKIDSVMLLMIYYKLKKNFKKIIKKNNK